MRTIGTAIAIACVVATASWASVRPVPPRWVAAGDHSDGGVVEVDAAQIVTAGGLTRGWWRIALTEPRADGTAREQNLDAIDCQRRLTTGLEQIRYNVTGATLAHTREEIDAALRRLSPATPGTPGEIADRAICRLRPKPQRR
ncbi:surface-adhesin E family protein [Sphingomonas oryzagri]